MENEHELSYETLTRVYLRSYEHYKSVGSEVEHLEPGFELDDQEWVEIRTFSFRRKWGMSRNEGITPLFIPILKLRCQGKGVRCHGSILAELENLGRSRDQWEDVELFKAMEMYQGACSRDAKSRYNTRLAQLLPRHIYLPCIVNWDVLNQMGCDGEIDDMLRIRLHEAGSNEEIFTYVAWIRAFNINEPIYAELCHEFYSTYGFDEVCAGDELQSNKIIRFRLGGRAHNLTLLEFAQRLGLYQVTELEEEGFNVYFEGGENVVVISSDKVEGSGDENSLEFQDTANSGEKKETKAMVSTVWTRKQFQLLVLSEKQLIQPIAAGTITIYPEIDPFLDDNEEEKNLDDWDNLLDFNLDDVALLGEKELPPFVCKMGKSSHNKKRAMENLNFFYQDIGTSSSAGVHLTREEAAKEALAIKMSRKFALLKEERTTIETMAYHDKYKKILDEVYKDKVELDGKIVKEEVEAVKRINDEALKENDDPEAFIFPISLDGQVNENALADTRLDINIMPCRIYEQLAREEMKKVDRGTTMINHTQAEAMGRLTIVLYRLWEQTMMRPDHHDPNALNNIRPWKRYCFHKFTIISCSGKDVTVMQSLELCHEFYSTYEFDKLCTDDVLQTKNIIKFRLGGCAYCLTLLEFTQRLGLYQVVELEEEGFNVYFEGGLHSDDHFNARDYWLSIRQEETLVYLGFISKIARKYKVLTKDVVRSLSAPIYCRDLDTTTLRDLINSDGKLILEDPQPGVPRVGIPRPPTASMQDLYDIIVFHYREPRTYLVKLSGNMTSILSSTHLHHYSTSNNKMMMGSVETTRVGCVTHVLIHDHKGRKGLNVQRNSVKYTNSGYKKNQEENLRKIQRTRQSAAHNSYCVAYFIAK
uniref:Uncharacterized protein n=1 Tax=Tanacetum cinerariifolium TaxID=118510 RepID=A0A6L2LM30_TANCI|nr:hypothetical protein [Tanacetum cinerariifolium]